MTYQDAIAVLKKDEEEDRSWRSARSKLQELFHEAEGAHRTVAAATQQRQEL